MSGFENELLKAANFSPLSLQLPDAWCGHLPFAAWLIKSFKPKTFVELGTHTGNSFFAFCQAAIESQLATKCYAVDTWQGDEHAGVYGDEIFHQVSTHHQEHYSGFARLMRMTFDEATSYFSDASIDLLHIDGLHTYEAVKHDFENWLPKLAPGSIVLFHDTNVRERDFGVWKLWAELQSAYPNNLEFTHSNGLGVLQLNNAPEGKRLSWLGPDYQGRRQLADYFSALGAKQVDRLSLEQQKLQTAYFRQSAAELEQQLTTVHQTISEKDAYLKTLEDAFRAKSQYLSELEQRFHKLEAEAREAIQAKSNQLLELESTLRQQADNLEQLKREIKNPLLLIKRKIVQSLAPKS